MDCEKPACVKDLLCKAFNQIGTANRAAIAIYHEIVGGDPPADRAVTWSNDSSMLEKLTLECEYLSLLCMELEAAENALTGGERE